PVPASQTGTAVRVIEEVENGGEAGGVCVRVHLGQRHHGQVVAQLRQVDAGDLPAVDDDDHLVQLVADQPALIDPAFAPDESRAGVAGHADGDVPGLGIDRNADVPPADRAVG